MDQHESTWILARLEMHMYILELGMLAPQNLSPKPSTVCGVLSISMEGCSGSSSPCPLDKEFSDQIAVLLSPPSPESIKVEYCSLSDHRFFFKCRGTTTTTSRNVLTILSSFLVVSPEKSIEFWWSSRFVLQNEIFKHPSVSFGSNPVEDESLTKKEGQ